MPFVTDTHSLVWYMTNDSKLSAKVRKIFQKVDDGREQVFIPCVVFFELLYLAEKKKIKPSFSEFLSVLSSSDNYKVEPLCIPVIKQCQRIPRDNVKYPWDRLILATSLHLCLPLITRDSKLSRLGFEVVW